MTIELWSILVTGGMMWVSIAAQQMQLDLKAGVAYALSNRETAPPDMPSQDRMLRAIRNQGEAAVVWFALVFVQQSMGVTNGFTQYAAMAMIASRLLYFPLYTIGAVPFRSLSWALFFMGAPVFAYGVLFA